MLSVDPLLQANGLGRRLIDAAEGEAGRRFGSGRVQMTVIKGRTELIDYYVRRGYVPTGEERPFPLDDPRFGLPRTRDLCFVVLNKPIGAPSA
jgi:GNAT superfamily N-acetyltransferase